MAQGLEHGGAYNAVAGKQEAYGNGPKGRDSDVQHILRCFKDQKQFIRKQLEYGETDQHNAHRVADG